MIPKRIESPHYKISYNNVDCPNCRDKNLKENGNYKVIDLYKTKYNCQREDSFWNTKDIKTFSWTEDIFCKECGQYYSIIKEV